MKFNAAKTIAIFQVHLIKSATVVVHLGRPRKLVLRSRGDRPTKKFPDIVCWRLIRSWEDWRIFFLLFRTSQLYDVVLQRSTFSFVTMNWEIGKRKWLSRMFFFLLYESLQENGYFMKNCLINKWCCLKIVFAVGRAL